MRIECCTVYWQESRASYCFVMLVVSRIEPRPAVTTLDTRHMSKKGASTDFQPWMHVHLPPNDALFYCFLHMASHWNCIELISMYMRRVFRYHTTSVKTPGTRIEWKASVFQSDPRKISHLGVHVCVQYTEFRTRCAEVNTLCTVMLAA